MFGNSLIVGSRLTKYTVISGTQSNVQLWLYFGQITEPADLYVSIPTGSEITGLDLTGINPLSLLYITCDGYLMGNGGDGGRGYQPFQQGPPGEPDEPAVPATPGGDGGHGLDLVCPTSIDFSNGFLYAGGGGGGGGGASIYGGGGGGVHDGLGGAGGGVFSSTGTPGTASTTGPTAVPGVGGDNGGDGGDKGEVGGPGIGPSSEVGGAAGLAIQMNGFELVFVGKDEATLVSENRLIGSVV